MCTSDCKCYAGSGDATKNLWKSYDETVIMDKFLRNTSDKNKKSSTKLTTYPLQWNADLETSFTDFRTCHVKKLVPKRKYESEVPQDLREGFFEKGTFDFLVRLETDYEDCASICETPLFYLTRNIAKGMP